MEELIAWPERVDHLGRILPGATVAELIDDVKDGVTSRGLGQILSLVADPSAHAAIVAAARQMGHTHYPPGLDGRASPLP